MKNKDYTLMLYIESYGTCYIDYNGIEVDRPVKMTLKQANYLSYMIYDSFVKKLL